MRRIWTILFWLIVAGPFYGFADAQDRKALILANAGYTHITPLTNTIRDARLVEGALRRAGFDITVQSDLDRAGMDAAIDAFTDALDASPGTIALVYFSGHGLQSDFDDTSQDRRGRTFNYVLGIDFDDSAGADAFGESALKVDGPGSIAERLKSSAASQNIIVVDACRNEYTPRSAVLQRGFSVEAAEPAGDTFFIFATSPGDVALDQAIGASEQNGPFALAFSRVIQFRGHTLAEMVPAITEEVRRLTGGRQTPWTYGAHAVDFKFLPGVKEGLDSLIADAEQAIWDAARTSGSKLRVSAFIDTYPSSQYLPAARALLDRLNAGLPVDAAVAQDSASMRQFGLTVAQDFAGDAWTVRDIASGSLFEGKFMVGDELFKIDGENVRDVDNPDTRIRDTLHDEGRISVIVLRRGRPYTVNIR